MKKTFIYLSFIIFLGWFPSLFAGEIYVSLQGNDKNPGTKEAPFYTLNRAIKQAREWRRLNRPEVAGGIYIRLEEGVYALASILSSKLYREEFIFVWKRVFMPSAILCFFVRKIVGHPILQR